MLSVSMLSRLRTVAVVSLEARSFRVSRCSVCHEVMRHGSIRMCGCKNACVEDGIEWTIYTERRSIDWTGFKAVIVDSCWALTGDRFLEALAAWRKVRDSNSQEALQPPTV